MIAGSIQNVSTTLVVVIFSTLATWISELVCFEKIVVRQFSMSMIVSLVISLGSFVSFHNFFPWMVAAAVIPMS
uniref:Uncharacterized protein n=1 Tax=Arundo donax TaxID=35708 RepID=A0A0A8ZQZ1_ARUDO